MLVEALFWLSIALVVYVYLGHPAFVYLLAQLRPNIWTQRDSDLSVAVFVSVFNEESAIRKKIRNILEQDYQGSLTIIVANDGSTDRTASIVRSIGERNVVLYDFRSNRGKAAMQNEVIPALNQDVVIFSDATSVWQKDTLKKIIRNFYDANVGCVAVDVCFKSTRDGAVQRGQGAYWSYERFLRRYGALVATNIVASGTTYAVRRSLFRPIPSDVGEDLSTPLQIAMAGKRVVFDSDVIVEEVSSATHAKEMHMRTRIAVRNFAGLVSNLKFLRPKYGFAAYQLLMHKYLRMFCWLPMVLALVLNCFLWRIRPYNYLLSAQSALYGLALIGYVNAKVGGGWRFASLAYYFVLLNCTSMLGFVYYLKGVRRATWNPDR